MSHHKRRRPKHQRRGCLLCKPHKDEREPDEPPASARRRLQDDPMALVAGHDDISQRELDANAPCGDPLCEACGVVVNF